MWFPSMCLDHSNVSLHPYIGQASLPIRYWTKSVVASASAITMDAICSSVISEGGLPLQDMSGRPFVTTGELANTASGTLLVIRCKAQLNSINQNVVVIPTDVNYSVADAGCWFEIRRNRHGYRRHVHECKRQFGHRGVLLPETPGLIPW
jgi:hypothetical protein